MGAEAPGGERACNGCTLCCKVMSISALNKPKDKWCVHCRIGSGCMIYADRPEECRTFRCGYLVPDLLSARWEPALCKMVVVSESGTNRISIHVDPGKPGAWRDEPYYSEIKQWAVGSARMGQPVLVCIGSKTIAVLPDRDLDLGQVTSDDRIVSTERETPAGRVLDVIKLRHDDPALKAMIKPVFAL